MSDYVQFRHELSQNELYLGQRDIDIVQKVEWKKDKHGAFIASKQAVAEYEAALAAYAAQSEASKGIEANGVEMMKQPRLKPAEFTLVAKISPSRCYLKPDGWKGPIEFTKTLADMKLECRLIAPGEAPFDQEFVLALENIRKLLDAGGTKGYKKQGIFDPQCNLNIKVRHVVFKHKNKNEGEKHEDNAFKLSDWPVNPHSPTALAAHKEMVAKDSHRVHPLPTYNVDGDLIAPADYSKLLPGAVVRAEISITHWVIANDNRDAYVAEIECFRLIVPASAQAQAQTGPSSIRKKKVLAEKDDGPSPKKVRT
ncbi:hypothetical protein MSAN_01386000 [Mycena sanguinolenta]|uniref:Uncharacterized protein n=1 Tax=Mycena sanguinolenta TaxID=230812 RepID=A0A8H6Y5R0_9AGAR|nr:hypothetical protein MSAN_01386000 [Mycena sanguinolenta]